MTQLDTFHLSLYTHMPIQVLIMHTPGLIRNCQESMVEGESAVQGYAVAKTAGELRVAGFREAFEGERLAQEPPAGVPQETE